MLQLDVKPDSFMHHLSPKIQSADTLGSSLTSPSQGTGRLRGHQGAICPEASFDYKDSPLQDHIDTDLIANCVLYNAVGKEEVLSISGLGTRTDCFQNI